MRARRLIGAFAALVVVPPAVTALALALALPAVAQEKPGPARDVKVKWYGQACFELDFPTGLVVLVDPFDAGKIGSYKFPKDVKPDVVTISHEHGDHNNDKEVAGSPRVLRGLTSADPKTQDWQKHDLVVKGVRIRTVGVYHDEKQGSERGKNAIFVFEPENKGEAFATIAHLGDLGHQLSDEQLKAVGPVDAVLVPVGGHFTIDAAAAKKVCDALKPQHFIVPMHYKTPALKPELPLATAEDFLKLYPDHVAKIEGNEYDMPRPGKGDFEPDKVKDKLTVLVLGYEPKEKASVAKGYTLNTGEHKAWIDSMGGKKELHATMKIEASGDATLKVASEILDKSGKSLGPLLLEDDATNKPVPKDGWKLKAGETRSLTLVAKDGQSFPGAEGGKIKTNVWLDTGNPNVKGPTSTAETGIQDVQ